MSYAARCTRALWRTMSTPLRTPLLLLLSPPVLLIRSISGRFLQKKPARPNTSNTLPRAILPAPMTRLEPISLLMQAPLRPTAPQLRRSRLTKQAPLPRLPRLLLMSLKTEKSTAHTTMPMNSRASARLCFNPSLSRPLRSNRVRRRHRHRRRRLLHNSPT